MKRWGMAIVALAMVAAAGAQTQPLVLQVSTLFDGRGKVLHDTRVSIADGKIVAIDPRLTGRMVDLRGLTVMPGWIDVHVHMTYHFGTNGMYPERVCPPAGRRGGAPAAGTAAPPAGMPGAGAPGAAGAFGPMGGPPQECESAADAELGIMHNAWATLHAGFTTVQSVGAPGDKDLREFINRGEIPGPRILTAYEPITDARMTPDQMRAWVHMVKDNGADLLKIFASDSIRDGGNRTLNDDQLAAACGEAKAVGLRSLVHAYKDAVRAAALAGCTEVEHGTLAGPDDLRVLAARGVLFDPQAGLVLHNYLDNRAHFQGGNFNDAGFAAMQQAVPLILQIFKEGLATPGLTVLFGTDAVAGAHGRNAEEFIYRVKEGGQDPMAALVTAQSINAASLRLGDQIGTIAPGYQADIIALNGDPLKDITVVRNVVFVMKGGTVYRDDFGR